MKKTEGKHTKSRMKFIAFLYGESEHQRQNGHISLANNYASAGNSFSRFLQTKGKSEIAFRKITSQIISDYEAWLQTCGLCRNTTSFYIRALQSVYHKAVRYQSVDGTQQREDNGDISEVARMQRHQQNKPRLAEQRVQENQKE